MISDLLSWEPEKFMKGIYKPTLLLLYFFSRSKYILSMRFLTQRKEQERKDEGTKEIWKNKKV